MLTDALITPFTEFEFMRRALAAVIALSLGGAALCLVLAMVVITGAMPPWPATALLTALGPGFTLSCVALRHAA